MCCIKCLRKWNVKPGGNAIRYGFSTLQKKYFSSRVREFDLPLGFS
jgi:hypothetical protein